jgi:hypothetical protein
LLHKLTAANHCDGWKPELFHRIVTTGIERMTAQQSTQRHDAPARRTVPTNRFSGILGTRGIESARRWKKGRNEEFIEPKKCD